MEPSKRDWKLYREEVSGWQGYYTGRLIEDYVAYLNSNGPASTKFRIMEKRTGQDRKTPGVCMELNRGSMIFDLVRFLQDEVIVSDGLDEFSEELRENMKLLKRRFGRLKCKRMDRCEWRCEHRYVYMGECDRITFRVGGAKSSVPMGD